MGESIMKTTFKLSVLIQGILEHMLGRAWAGEGVRGFDLHSAPLRMEQFSSCHSADWPWSKPSWSLLVEWLFQFKANKATRFEALAWWFAWFLRMWFEDDKPSTWTSSSLSVFKASGGIFSHLLCCIWWPFTMMAPWYHFYSPYVRKKGNVLTVLHGRYSGFC